MALLALSNEGVPAHFFHLVEAPMMRLPNVKIFLCWPSRMHIYGFVSNRTFLEQFVSMGDTSAFLNIMVIAVVPPFRRGRHRRQSEAIVEDGMGPDD